MAYTYGPTRAEAPAGPCLRTRLWRLPSQSPATTLVLSGSVDPGPSGRSTTSLNDDTDAAPPRRPWDGSPDSTPKVPRVKGAFVLSYVTGRGGPFTRTSQDSLFYKATTPSRRLRKKGTHRGRGVESALGVHPPVESSVALCPPPPSTSWTPLCGVSS